MKKIIILLFIFSTYSKINAQDKYVLSYLDSINYYLDSAKVAEPKYVLAQSCYESGWFRCKNCTWENNNMFGFRGQNGQYMKFKNWRDCVRYYCVWQHARYPNYKNKHPKGTYLGFLKWSHYAESNDYQDKITWMHNWVIKNWKHN